MDNLAWKKIKEAGAEYLRTTNTPGYRYLIERVAFERYVWYFIHTCTLLSTYFIGRYTWDNFMMNPIITTVNSLQFYTVKDIAMPGISVCNINKISKMKADAYAGELSRKSGKPIEEILEGIKLLATMDNYNLPPGKDISFQFQTFLDMYDTDNDGYYNTHDKLRMLQLPCAEMLQDCFLYKKQRKCEDLFVDDLTMEGHCCIFNYLSQSAKNISTVLLENDNKPIVAGNIEEGGLKFKLNYNISDYMATSLATTGVKILVSLPRDFPDTTSGSLLEILVGVGVQAFVCISSTVTYTTDEVRKYAIQQRGCIFPDEVDTIFGGYSYSDCIMDCKIKSIGDLCGCIPFNYINVFRSRVLPQCTLADLKCLSSYTAKWRSMNPGGFEDPTRLTKERQDAMRCTNCVPACSDTLYSARSEILDLYQSGTKVDNFSIVHVVFRPPTVTSNKQDAFFYWYDMISLFGGLCSLVMGISFISVVELLYSFTYLFGKKLLNKPRARKEDSDSD